MKSRFYRRTLLASAVASGTLICSLWFLPGLLSNGELGPELSISSSEAVRLFDVPPAEFHGPGPAKLASLVNSLGYFKLRMRLMFGAKLYRLATTNASLSDLSQALAAFTCASGVIAPGDFWQLGRHEFGSFNSDPYGMRWSAARAIGRTLQDAGWRVLGASDGKLIVVSQGTAELLLAAGSPALQWTSVKTFADTKNRLTKQYVGTMLERLWRDGFLDDKVKEELTKQYYRLDMRQQRLGIPGWEVRLEQTFPFPDVWTQFEAKLYKNNKLVLPLGNWQGEHAMNARVNSLAMMSGGPFRNGDVLQCKIELAQKIRGREWHISLWTNKIVLEGLKE
jgi:hypothetical protein